MRKYDGHGPINIDVDEPKERLESDVNTQRSGECDRRSTRTKVCMQTYLWTIRPILQIPMHRQSQVLCDCSYYEIQISNPQFKQDNFLGFSPMNSEGDLRSLRLHLKEKRKKIVRESMMWSLLLWYLNRDL